MKPDYGASSPELIAEELSEHFDDHNRVAAVAGRIHPDVAMPVAQILKGKALVALRRDAKIAQQLAELIVYFGQTAAQPLVQALGLQTLGTLQTLAYRDYEKALDRFATASELFDNGGDELNLAITQVTRVWALACLQRYDEAFETGEWAAEIFRRHDAHRPLAALSNNLAITHSRRGNDAAALMQLDAVIEAYQALGAAGTPHIPFALINRSIALRNLGRFQESIAANVQALEMAEKLEQSDTSARAKQNLGITYFTQGRLSEAQALLEEARKMFIADNRLRDAILADLYISDGLLQLRRFDEVIEKCRQVRETFGESGIQFEVAQAWLNEATARTGLGDYEAAESALTAARTLFENEQNQAWQLYTDLEHIANLLAQQRFETAVTLGEATLEGLQPLDLPVKEAQANLLLAQAYYHLNGFSKAAKALVQVLHIAATREVPALAYQAHYWRGRIQEAEKKPALALAAYDAAIRQLELLQGQIMVEFRADFLVDKQAVYEAAVALCLEAGNPQAGLQMAERARSRALLDLVTHRVDMRLEARAPQDQPLVAELHQLREERNRLQRYWDSREIPGSDGHEAADPQGEQEAREQLRRQTIQVENQIKKRWHQLLVRNQAYGREASLWQVNPSRPLPVPKEDTALIEYFAVNGRLTAFVVTSDGVVARPLPLTVTAMHKRQQALKHQLDTINRMPGRATLLLPKAQIILKQLYEGLIAPVSDCLAGHRQLILVPQGGLHYLPWSALFDGHEYLLHRFEIAILPAASLLEEIGDGDREASGVCLMGHTRGGQLPQVAEELDFIARLTGGTPQRDAAATRTAFLEKASDSGIIHLATHGEFRHTEPLFSGLQMADGLLTTLDIFNTRLHAALVNLSACQTGRAVIGGGDELFGLMRAFLAAGASALVMSLWRVNDRSTAELMKTFYEELMAGTGRGEALRQAQLRLLNDENGATQHPYFWAPFFLVGETAPLPGHLR
ncbi:MAG: CHAT domain-containing tetratricopeptide repeat protein [Ardenticatenaceae bacterium]|nr:CHAT domain-containing tetratricopeptide repeat protein [Ardenticatenaceae bacterium]